jgi:hypothetical protein
MVLPVENGLVIAKLLEEALTRLHEDRRQNPAVARRAEDISIEDQPGFWKRRKTDKKISMGVITGE